MHGELSKDISKEIKDIEKKKLGKMFGDYSNEMLHFNVRDFPIFWN
jgi:hypothetical protein